MAESLFIGIGQLISSIIIYVYLQHLHNDIGCTIDKNIQLPESSLSPSCPTVNIGKIHIYTKHVLTRKTRDIQTFVT